VFKYGYEGGTMSDNLIVHNRIELSSSDTEMSFKDKRPTNGEVKAYQLNEDCALWKKLEATKRYDVSVLQTVRRYKTYAKHRYL